MPEQFCFQSFEETGFGIVHGAISEELLEDMSAAMDELAREGEPQADYGARGLLEKSQRMRELAAEPALLDLAKQVLGPHTRAVKGTFFDKNAEANWLVPWHQDLTITVRKQRDTPGYIHWAMKSGLLHVQPPTSVMEGIVALRIHLDGASADNGALRVLPGTHCRGRIPSKKIAELAETIPAVTCEAKRGDVLLMRPLLLHASSVSKAPKHRRVIHLEYAYEDLPDGLEWCG